ncbi:hypothetical protein MPLSOD_40990 [Mesorhizobium sp. SOD10]|nr:hypothetical protein MPLSOD_40990 [Mesorhizobium sp. SOD10]
MNNASVSIINKSDLIIDSGCGLVSFDIAPMLGELRWALRRRRLAGAEGGSLGGNHA